MEGFYDINPLLDITLLIKIALKGWKIPKKGAGGRSYTDDEIDEINEIQDLLVKEINSHNKIFAYQIQIQNSILDPSSFYSIYNTPCSVYFDFVSKTLENYRIRFSHDSLEKRTYIVFKSKNGKYSFLRESPEEELGSGFDLSFVSIFSSIVSGSVYNKDYPNINALDERRLRLIYKDENYNDWHAWFEKNILKR